MNAVALDLSPVVDALLERPFDRPTLDKVYNAVEGHPQAYATALRCAAKRSEDLLAAAYWLTEAARVHESVDDLGGSIALLSRARDCDPENPRTRELLAACMTRLAIRAGLAFTFTSEPLPTQEALDGSRPPPRESGLRPPPPEMRRDTLPDLFGLDSERPRSADPEVARIEPAPATVRAPALEAVTPADPVPVLMRKARPEEPTVLEDEEVVAEPEPVVADPEPKETATGALDSNPVIFPLTHSRRVEPLLPPSDPEAPAETVVPQTEAEPALHAIADIALSTRRSDVLLAHPVQTTGVVSVEPRLLSTPDVYGEPTAPKTVRPVGDRLVGELFEALHGFHFLDDVREAATFLGRVLDEKMRATTTLVHVYDINSRHFVVMSASGPRSGALVDYATPEDEPFVVEVMKEDEATLVLAPSDDSRLSRGRWLLIEPRASVLCAPVVADTRYLGLVELIDPIDGSEFNEDDRNALTYAASAFGKFLLRRGIVLSEEPGAVEELRSSTG